MGRKKNSFFVGLMLLVAQAAVAAVPKIQNFVGQPLIELVDGQNKIIPVKNKTIEQSFTVKTLSREQIKFELGKEFYLIVLPESNAKIEGYYSNPTDFKIKSLIFKSGRFYLKNGSNLVDDLSVTYQSDFFVWKNSEKNNQREFFIELNPAQAQVRICAGEQGVAASIWDHETVKQLKYQEGATFQGVLKDGELEFDLLLEKRKVPKGEWKDSFTCDFKQILKETHELEILEAKRAKKAEQTRKIEAKKRQAEYDKSVCHSPNGQFNECLWKLENTSCVRYRCDGQGHWQDRQVLPKNQKYRCETKNNVAQCDY